MKKIVYVCMTAFFIYGCWYLYKGEIYNNNYSDLDRNQMLKKKELFKKVKINSNPSRIPASLKVQHSQPSFQTKRLKLTRFKQMVKQKLGIYAQSIETYNSTGKEYKYKQDGKWIMHMESMGVMDAVAWKDNVKDGFVLRKAGYVIYKVRDNARSDTAFKAIYNGRDFSIFTGKLKIRADLNIINEIAVKYGMNITNYFPVTNSAYLLVEVKEDPVLLAKEILNERGIKHVSLELLTNERFLR